MNTTPATPLVPSLMVTDYIVFALLIVFLISGWAKGIVRTLIGPLSLMISVFASTFYFDLSQDLGNCILFGLAGTLLLTAIGYITLFIVRRTISPESRDYIFWGSRVLGALVSVLWKGILLSFLIVFITVLPPTIFGFEAAQKNIKDSLSYDTINKEIIARIPLAQNIKEFLTLLDSPERLEKVKATKEFQDLIQDPKMQDLLKDFEVVEAVNRKDVLRLLFDRKIVALLNDKVFVQKFLAFSKVMYQSRSDETSPAP